MKTALVLGGASCIWDDIERAREVVDFCSVVACNDIGAEWPGDLDAWVSLHPRFFDTGPSWKLKREENEHSPAKRYFGHPPALEPNPCDDSEAETFITPTPYDFAGEKSGSSGLFAAKVALVDLGHDRVVLCGIPMTPTAHFNEKRNWTEPNTGGKSSAFGFRNSWLAVPEGYRNRMRSLSGWTKILLGSP